MATQTHIHRKKNSTSKAASDGPNGIWLPLLDSVGTGKRLAEKSLLVLGEFVFMISLDSRNKLTVSEVETQHRNESSWTYLQKKVHKGGETSNERSASRHQLRIDLRSDIRTRTFLM